MERETNTRRNVIGTILITLLIVGALGAIGFGVYQLGFDRGLVESGADIVVNRVGPGLRHAIDRPGWGFGWFGAWGIFGLFFKILFLVLIIGLISRLFWGPRRWGPPGPWRHEWHDDQSPIEHRFDEWHRRAHGDHPEQRPEPGSTS